MAGVVGRTANNQGLMRRIILIALALPLALAFGGSVSAAVRTGTQPAQTLSISNASSTPVRSKAILVPGHAYELVIRGTVSDWCSSAGCPTGDPAKVPQPNVGQDALYGYAPWRFAHPQITRQLLINGLGLDQLAHEAGKIPYSPSHTYRVRVTGLHGRLSFLSADASSVSNNSGAWTVTIDDLGQTKPVATKPTPTPKKSATPKPTAGSNRPAYRTEQSVENQFEDHGFTLMPGTPGGVIITKPYRVVVDTASCLGLRRYGVRPGDIDDLYHGFDCTLTTTQYVWDVYVIAYAGGRLQIIRASAG